MSEFMRALTRFYGGLVFRIRDLLYAILVWTLVSLRKFLRLCVVSLAPLGLVGAIWLHWPNYTDRCVGLAPKEAQDLLRTNASGWYNQEGADTVVIFVHGFMSNNVTAWCYLDQDNPREDTFFPELIRNDMRLGEDAVDIFIAGYFTSLTSTEFDVRATARALYSDLRRQDSRLLRNNVFDYDKIIFVAHSAGGIVVRQMLVEHVDWLSGKHIGLVLLASPSAGSLYAYQFTQAIDILENAFAAQLSPGSDTLTTLDSEFRQLQLSRNFRICGKELMEHYALYGIGPLEVLGKVVGTDAAGKYFGDAILIEDTNHISIAKPTGLEHRTYKEFFDFYVYEFCNEA